MPGLGSISHRHAHFGGKIFGPRRVVGGTPKGRIFCTHSERVERPLAKQDLVAYIQSGCKPREQWRIGTEHEKLGYYKESKKRIDYGTIRQLLQGICDRYSWEPIMEGGNIIGAVKDGQSVTIEPGGQFELSGAPVKSLQDTHAEVQQHLEQVKEIAEGLDVAFLTLGFDPKWNVRDIPIMPKNRYRVMADYMPRVGSLGHDMMFRSTTIQVNIDFEDERDMVEKMRIGLALQPVATALFANSPFRDGKDTGYLSWRSHVWEDVDADREFLDGRLPILPGERPTLKDWEVHLTTIFPEVRLKRYMEMRGGDGGPLHMIVALSSFWIGLLYSKSSQQQTYDIIKGWTLHDHQTLRSQVPRTGLQTPFQNGSLQDVAKKALELSRHGLKERGMGEEKFLDPLDKIADSGRPQSLVLTELYHTKWSNSVDHVYSPEFSF